MITTTDSTYFSAFYFLQVRCSMYCIYSTCTVTLLIILTTTTVLCCNYYQNWLLPLLLLVFYYLFTLSVGTFLESTQREDSVCVYIFLKSTQ